MGPDWTGYEERLCWRGPSTIYCTELDTYLEVFFSKYQMYPNQNDE
jgi:hypothetical protein